ncbi:MAG: hypothetical protein IKA87_00810 [Lentisphaeria bacterium]|nr:hypothetical protein [Lentisphaeria bacterium]
MKIVNILLSILILLLSAAAATFSYFLFEKRSQFVTGWAKMASTINESAAALDKGSGTKLAEKLTKQTMAHENYDKLDSLLPELPKLSKQIIIERDALADALTRISSAIRMKNRIPGDRLCNLNTYNAAKNDVVSGVNDVVNRRDRTYNNVISAVRSAVGAQIDRNKLLAGDASALNPMKNEVSKIRSRSAYYERSLNEIARNFRVRNGRFTDQNYAKEIAKIKSAITVYQRNNTKLASDLNKAKRDIASRDRTIASLRGNIKKLTGDVADRDSQIVSFQRAFGLPASGSGATPWLPGSVESRRKLEGKVVSVNNKYGYIAINIGKYTVVEQNIGNRTIEINPNVEPGMPLLITRKSGSSSDFISRVLIAQVGETSSIANIPTDAKNIKVGDTVTIAIDEKPVQDAAPAAKTAKRK